ncbi:deleted in azoospermia-like [Rhinophrynus dorsalis]
MAGYGVEGVGHVKELAPGCLWAEDAALHSAPLSAAIPESQSTAVTGEEETQSSSSATCQGYVLPEGKIMPNTVFVGGIDIRMDEIEIRDFFARFGTVKEVKIITDRTGVSKGYGFVSFYDEVDVQKIVDSQIHFHGKKLKLGPAIRKMQNVGIYVQNRPVVLSPPAQFHNVWNNPNVDTYIQHPPLISPVAPYMQACPYQSSHPMVIQQIPFGCQQPGYYQVSPQWSTDQRSYMFPPPAFPFNYHCGEVDPAGNDILQTEYPVLEQTVSPSGTSPQKKSVDRSIQTVVSCLFSPDNRMQRSFVPQEEYLKDKRVHQFRRSRAIFKTVTN